jgi:hypothetical protein
MVIIKAFLLNFVVCTLIGIAPVNADDYAINIAEHLMWFPDESFERISFALSHDGLEGERREAYMAFLGRTSLIPSSFPAELQVECLSYAQVSRVKVKLLEVDGKKEKKADAIYNVAIIRTGDSTYVFGNEGDRLTVFRFFDLDAKIKAAVANGSISPVSTFSGGIHVYSMMLGRDESTLRYICPMENEFLLVAPTLQSVREMIMAGTGQSVNLLDSDIYGVIKAAGHDLGVSWSCWISRSLFEAAVDYLSGQGEMVEIGDEQQEQIDRDCWCYFQATSLDDGPAYVLIECYRGDKQAEDAKRTYPARQLALRAGSDPSYLRLRDERYARTELIVRDNLLITKTRYDEELIHLERERSEAVAQKREEREKEKKK